ncbi:MAG: cation transporter [Candidatus Rokuibacteriota bacterium]|nr:MAG: cation transporter [Candidatus Rokubacteria bacterium]
MWALKWSFLGLLATALLQLGVVVISGSVALLADTIHNFADAATAIPLAIAFAFARVKPSRRFPYGYGRVEDLAGVLIVLTMLVTVLIAGYESVLRLLRPQPVGHLWAVAGASVIGCLGNEAVALFRIKVGREIGSAALVADGYHARADGVTSLAVLGGTAGVWLGYPLADPLMGLLITGVILHLVWQSAHAVFTRMLDGVDPEILDAAEHAAKHVSGVSDVAEVRARWIGHRLTMELNVAVNADLSVTEGHGVAKEIRHRILHQVPHVSGVTVHVDPATQSGETFHGIDGHAHDGLPIHSHR